MSNLHTFEYIRIQMPSYYDRLQRVTMSAHSLVSETQVSVADKKWKRFHSFLATQFESSPLFFAFSLPLILDL